MERELWFESSGVWTTTGAEQPYKDAVAALLRRPQALSADLLLIDNIGRWALILECKDSDDPTYVGREGYHQATTYLVEAHSRLSDETVSLIVGKAGAVHGMSITPLAGGLVGLIDADFVADLVGQFVQGQTIGIPVTPSPDAALS
jgi:hypothetical protein